MPAPYPQCRCVWSHSPWHNGCQVFLGNRSSEYSVEMWMQTHPESMLIASICRRKVRANTANAQLFLRTTRPVISGTDGALITSSFTCGYRWILSVYISLMFLANVGDILCDYITKRMPVQIPRFNRAANHSWTSGVYSWSCVLTPGLLKS